MYETKFFMNREKCCGVCFFGFQMIPNYFFKSLVMLVGFYVCNIPAVDRSNLENL